MICIYCTRDLPKTGYKSKEHVIPKAFGKFSPNNLTLKYLVCDECNQKYGKTIDLILARGSLETVDRLKYGIKSPQEIRDLRRERVQFVLAQEGKWKGIYFEVKADPRGQYGLIIEPISQVGFTKRYAEGFIFVPEEVLKDENISLPDGIDLQKDLLTHISQIEIKPCYNIS